MINTDLKAMTDISYLPIFLVITVLIYWILKNSESRNLFLLVCSILFVAAFNIYYLFYFLFNIIIVYFAGVFISAKNKNKKLLIRFILIWLISNLCFFKLFGMFFRISCLSSILLEIGLAKILFPLGFSFIIFRLIHYIVEVYRGNIAESSFINFALYVLFFPTFLAGPIERFPNFYPQSIKNKNLDLYNINYGLWRIILGIIKKAFIADNLAKFIMPVFHSPGTYSTIIIVYSIIGGIVQLYMDFSGYSDIAIGIARLFGFKIMENFNRPFFRKNIILVMRNWHISFYLWIRDYFFFPIFGYRASRLKLYVGGFLTMLVFNLWHSFSANFLITGLLAGTSLVLWLLFQELQKRSAVLRNLLSNKWLDLSSRFFTLIAFSFSPVFLYSDTKNALYIIRRVFWIF